MTYIKYLVAILILCVVSLSYADEHVTLPWEKTFDSGYDWSGELKFTTDCGAGSGPSHTYRNTSEYCWSGGCADFKAPSAACASGDGGVSAYGWIFFDPQTTLNVRWLMKVGNTYTEDAGGGHWQYENKLLDIHGSGHARHGLVCTWRTGNYTSVGIWDHTNNAWFNNGTGWPDPDITQENAAVVIDDSGDNALTDVWLCFEFQVTVGGTQYIRMTEQDGSYVEWHAPAIQSSGTISDLYLGGYFNMHIPTERQSNHLIFDELRLVGGMAPNTFMGPPDGFLGDYPPPAPPNLRIE